jgi:hypothetical protein
MTKSLYFQEKDRVAVFQNETIFQNERNMLVPGQGEKGRRIRVWNQIGKKMQMAALPLSLCQK